tara:strand:+ start:246 stop:686 length:441 start_codon:yes stop_codon:yes gene_type:complete
MSMENFIDSLSDEQKSDLKKLLKASEDEANAIPAEHQEALNELDEVYHDSYLQTHDIKKVKVNEDFTVTRSDNHEARKTPVKFKKNKWIDTGEMKDVDTPNFEKTPRRNAAPPKKEIECHVCGKKFKADTRYISGEFHRCNKCIGK